MSVIASYDVNPSAPSVVGGLSTNLKWFGNGPVSNWNSSAPGVNARVDSAQFGNTPSATSAVGQLLFPTAKLNGGRCRVYATGVASSATTPTITPIVQINTGTASSPSYTTLLGNIPSNALVATKPVAWSIAGDLLFESISGTLSGFFKYSFANAAGGGLDKNNPEVAIAGINNLFVTAGQQGSGSAGASGFGLVVGISLQTSDVSNTASLFEFKITQD